MVWNRDNIEFEMNNIYNFLEISNNIQIDVTKKYNVGGKRWKNDKIKHFFLKNSLIKFMLKLLLPKKTRKVIRNKFTNLCTNKVTPMKEETRKGLVDYFKQDVERLSKLLKKDLKHWTK